MPSYYSVVRYLPSALAEEFVNVGVLTFGDGRVRARFLDDWRRVRLFAGHGVRAVLAVQREFEEGRFDEDAVRRTAREWAGSVQVSVPRAALVDPDALLERVARTFLRATPAAPKAFVNRSTVARRAANSLGAALQRRLPLLGRELLRMHDEVPGSIRAREFDIVVRNGIPLDVAQAFSFRIGDQALVLREVEAATVAFNDARERAASLQTSAILLPPANGSEEYDAAVRTLERAAVRVVTDANEPVWVNEIAERAAAHLAAQ